jgi:hypothetical protein
MRLMLHESVIQSRGGQVDRTAAVRSVHHLQFPTLWEVKAMNRTMFRSYLRPLSSFCFTAVPSAHAEALHHTNRLPDAHKVLLMSISIGPLTRRVYITTHPTSSARSRDCPIPA